MLAKLLKYEWKSTRRVMPLIYAAVLVLSICVGISFRNNTFDNVGLNNMLFLSIYLILVVAMIVVTIIVIIERFYRSMVWQEGYLMHTLPVKPWQHIISKTCIAIVWIAIAAGIMIVSFLLIGATSGLMNQLLEEMGITVMMETYEYFLTRSQFALLAGCTVLQVIRLIMQVYLSMSIGGSSVKNKLVYSFLAFIVLVVITSVVGSFVSMGALFGPIMQLFVDSDAALLAGNTSTTFAQDIDFFLKRLCVIQLIMDGVFLMVFFGMTNHFLQKRLNLE